MDEIPGADDVSNIDKQRIAAVRKLEALGYSYRDGEREWAPPVAATPQSLLMTVESDAMRTGC